MKPLVNYCRWNGAKLRLRARDDQFLQGQLVFVGEDGGENLQDFRYELANARLTLFKESGDRLLFLDEMGIVIKDPDTNQE